MTVCYKCGKPVKGKAVHIIPSTLALRLGDFPRAYHPACYAKVEKEAARSMRGRK